MNRIMHGFTLVELMVVIVIIGILGAVTIPKYNSSLRKARAAEAPIILGELAKAEHIYQLEYGVYTFIGKSFRKKNRIKIEERLGIDTDSDYFYYHIKRDPYYKDKKRERKQHYFLVAIPYQKPFGLKSNGRRHWIGLYDDGAKVHRGDLQPLYLPTWK